MQRWPPLSLCGRHRALTGSASHSYSGPSRPVGLIPKGGSYFFTAEAGGFCWFSNSTIRASNALLWLRS